VSASSAPRGATAVSASRGATTFLLSPAFCGGRRGQLLLGGGGPFALADRLRSGSATIGEVFRFVSGLYFRGKLAYARRFARAPAGEALVITPGWGLVRPRQPVSLVDLRAIAAVGVDPELAAYREPLRRDALALRARPSPPEAVVLLGSIASAKYVDVLLELLGERLLFPAEFVGRGDMSRGGLMLRCVLEDRELTYRPVAGAARRGPRPPRLAVLRGDLGRRARTL
jgi:hypothetical protein